MDPLCGWPGLCFSSTQLNVPTPRPETLRRASVPRASAPAHFAAGWGVSPLGGERDRAGGRDCGRQGADRESGVHTPRLPFGRCPSETFCFDAQRGQSRPGQCGPASEDPPGRGLGRRVPHPREPAAVQRPEQRPAWQGGDPAASFPSGPWASSSQTRRATGAPSFQFPRVRLVPRR